MIFKEFPKLPRFSRTMVISEKIDGTNSSIFIQAKALEIEEENGLSTLSDPHIVAVSDNYTMRVGSRTRWITPNDDNYGFANWVKQNSDDLFNLGEGHHFGEWWGSGIQRGYGLPKGEKRFSLFNTTRWKIDSFEEKGFQSPPKCCSIVPELYIGDFDSQKVQEILNELIEHGSYASPGFKNPEGIVIFHVAANLAFKKTCLKDEIPKSLIK